MIRGFVVTLFALTLYAGSPYTLSTDGLTVYDSVNGITWLANTNLPASNRFGIPACTGVSVGVQTCINASGSMNYNAAAAWVAAMNASNYMGHSNWQLPTTPLNDSNCGKTGPNGQNFGFGCTAGALATIYNAVGLKSPSTAVPIPANLAGPYSNVQPYLYWSQSVSGAGASSGNATFSFATGWQGANTLPNFLYLWPMVPGKISGAATASTVHDPVTNITWLANANLAAPFGLPQCTNPTTPSLCVAQDGAMTWASAEKYIANMNAAAYLGQTNWQAPTIASTCPGYGCTGADNPMGNLFYTQLGLIPGAAAVATPDISLGPFNNLQPYLYWTCLGTTIADGCGPVGPAANFQVSYSFGSGFQGTDLLANTLFVTAYFVGTRTSTAGPEITEVANAEGESPVIAPNTWIEIKGGNLAPAGDARTWSSSDSFANNQMPTALDKVSVTVNGKTAYVYYVSPTQINVLTPPDAMSGSVPVVVTNNGVSSAAISAPAQVLSPSLFVFGGGPYVAAEHAVGGGILPFIGPTSLYPGLTTPAKPGEFIILYANGFGPVEAAIVSGSASQSGILAPLPMVKIGGAVATVQYAGLVAPGLFQFNVVVPAGLGNGDQPIVATYNGQTTQSGTLITVQH